MLRLQNSNLIAAVAYIVGAASEWRVFMQVMNEGLAPPHPISTDNKAQFLHALKELREASAELEMVACHAAANRAFDFSFELLSINKPYGPHELQKLANQAEFVGNTFRDEMQARMVFVIPGRHAALYDQTAPFGEAVEDAFPSASIDIHESGNCIALGRWTASVMHLMRALEVSLATMAKHFGIDPAENWNKSLNQIEAALRASDRKAGGAEGEKWAAEAGTHLRFIKNAWRNHAMHARERYDEERAVAIYSNARSFMQHLATKMSEHGEPAIQL